MTTNGQPKKRPNKLTVAAIIAVVTLLLGSFLPCFAVPDVVVYDNSFIVSERNNMYFKSMLVDVITIDEKGRVEEETVRLYLEGDETEYRFTKEDLKEILETEDEVYIKGLTEKAILQITFFTPVVGTCYAILVFTALISVAFVGIWGAEASLRDAARLFKTIKKNLKRKKTQE